MLSKNNNNNTKKESKGLLSPLAEELGKENIKQADLISKEKAKEMLSSDPNLTLEEAQNKVEEETKLEKVEDPIEDDDNVSPPEFGNLKLILFCFGHNVLVFHFRL